MHQKSSQYHISKSFVANKKKNNDKLQKELEEIINGCILDKENDTDKLNYSEPPLNEVQNELLDDHMLVQQSEDNYNYNNPVENPVENDENNNDKQCYSDPVENDKEDKEGDDFSDRSIISDSSISEEFNETVNNDDIIFENETISYNKFMKSFCSSYRFIERFDIAIEASQYLRLNNSDSKNKESSFEGIVLFH